MREQNNEDWLKAAEERMKEHAQIPKLIKKLKLKPCPFCGYNAGISEPGEDVCRSDRYSVGCVYHACIVQPKITYGRGAYFSEIPELAKVWNKRSKRVEQENDA